MVRLLLPALTYWLGKVLPCHVEMPVAPNSAAEHVESMLESCRGRLGTESATRWKWAVLRPANAPDYIQRIAFLQKDDAEDFRRRFP